VEYTGAASRVTVPDTLNGYRVTSIGKRAFCGNYDLKSVTIPEGVISICAEAFYTCYSLESISLPGSLL